VQILSGWRRPTRCISKVRNAVRPAALNPDTLDRKGDRAKIASGAYLEPESVVRRRQLSRQAHQGNFLAGDYLTCTQLPMPVKCHCHLFASCGPSERGMGSEQLDFILG